MSRLLRVQVLFIKCGCAARVVIIEDVRIYTLRQHKRLSLVHEKGDPKKLGAGSDVGGAGSGSGLFQHKLSPVYNGTKYIYFK